MLDKIERLSAASDFVIYRWLTYGKRIENTYNRLADVRMQGMRYGNGKVCFFEAAPIHTQSGGMCRFLLRNDSVYNALTGADAGLLVSSIPENAAAEYAAAAHVSCERITEDTPKHKLELIRTLATSPYLPVSSIVTPTLYRLTRNLERLHVRSTPELLALLGLDPGTHPDVVMEAFVHNIDSIAMRTSSGFVVPADMATSGGTVVCDSTMVSRKSVSSIFGMPGKLFDNIQIAKGWHVNTCSEE